MSVGVSGRKKRLPNMTTSFERRDALPLGNFMKYTWQLTNILHVKQIFDTRQVSSGNCMVLVLIMIVLITVIGKSVDLQTLN